MGSDTFNIYCSHNFDIIQGELRTSSDVAVDRDTAHLDIGAMERTNGVAIRLRDGCPEVRRSI